MGKHNRKKLVKTRKHNATKTSKNLKCAIITTQHKHKHTHSIYHHRYHKENSQQIDK